jgi:hypothetical protein
MSHKVIDGNAIIDWETGDPEGDRAGYFKAMRYFLKELSMTCSREQLDLFNTWQVRNLEVDSFPRISIVYPEGYKHD